MTVDDDQDRGAGEGKVDDPHAFLTASELHQVTTMLTGNGALVSGPLRATPLLGGRSNLTFRVSDGTTSWVLRQPPRSGLTPSAHDMRREWTIISALQNSAVPVARPVASDLQGHLFGGTPTTIVEFVAGVTIRTSRDAAVLGRTALAANAKSLIRVLASLHDIDHREVGLEEFGRPIGFVERQVKLWVSQWNRVKTRELRDLDRLATSLADMVPSNSEHSIIHGDFRADNTIVSPLDVSEIRAVVDWELSTIGDPITDIALMCVYRQPEFDIILGEGAAWTSNDYPSAEQLAEWYSERTGRSLDEWGFYLGLANLKLAVIGEGITHRARAAGGSSPSALRAFEATPAFVAAGLRAVRSPHRPSNLDRSPNKR